MWYGKAGTAHWREPLAALCIKDLIRFLRFMCSSLAENSFRIFRPLLSFVWKLLIKVGLLSAEKPPPKALCISSAVYKQRNSENMGNAEMREVTKLTLKKFYARIFSTDWHSRCFVIFLQNERKERFAQKQKIDWQVRLFSQTRFLIEATHSLDFFLILWYYRLYILKKLLLLMWKCIIF